MSTVVRLKHLIIFLEANLVCAYVLLTTSLTLYPRAQPSGT